jgi:hypothetical protein
MNLKYYNLQLSILFLKYNILTHIYILQTFCGYIMLWVCGFHRCSHPSVATMVSVQ